MNVDESDPLHEEVWDDSLLIDSWNQALQEYKVKQIPQPCRNKEGDRRLNEY